MKIIKLNKTNQGKIIEQTIKVLNHGGLVVFPSDTVYGLLADSTNSSAIDKLLAFKERPAGKAISVFVADEKMASKYVIINQNAKNVIKNLLPGPFTVICSARCHPAEQQGDTLKNPRKAIDPRLLAENGTLGFRIPDYPLILELVKQFGKPVTATSANISSTPPHYSVESLLKSIKPCKGGVFPPATKWSENPTPTKTKINLIDLIVDAGKLPRNKPSTVIDTTTGQLTTLRLGDLLPKTPNSLISKSEKETQKLAQFILSKSIQKSLSKPVVFLLQGELGTGKTIFTKGLGKALKIKDEIVSPTYTICYEYKIDIAMSSRPKWRDPFPVAGERDSLPALLRKALQAGSTQFTPSGIEGPGITNGQSTKNDQLSTDSPIKYRLCSDTERLDPNTNFIEQIPIGRIMNYELCIKGGSKTLSSHNSKYIIQNSFLVHYDLYRIETKEDLKEIKFLESIQPGNIYAIEWPEKIDQQTISKLKEIAQVIYIKINHINKKEREISWSEE